MSADFDTLWNDLVNPPGPTQADADYAAVSANPDVLPLSNQEAYNVAWGPDATPDAWLRERAQALSDQINGADSTAVLKRGRAARPLTQAEQDAAAVKADAAAAGVTAATAPTSPHGGSGDAPATGTPAVDNVYGIGPGFDMDSAATAGKAGLAFGGPVAGAIAAVGGGLVGGYKSPSEVAAEVASLDATLAALDASRHGSSNGASSAGMGGASEGSAGSTAATAESPDGPDGNNGGTDAAGGTNGNGGGSDSGGPGSDRD